MGKFTRRWLAKGTRLRRLLDVRVVCARSASIRSVTPRNPLTRASGTLSPENGGEGVDYNCFFLTPGELKIYSLSYWGEGAQRAGEGAFDLALIDFSQRISYRLAGSKPKCNSGAHSLYQPTTHPSLRGSEPPISTPVSASIMMAWYPPNSPAAWMISWPFSVRLLRTSGPISDSRASPPFK